jgi:hypothetical protein
MAKRKELTPEEKLEQEAHDLASEVADRLQSVIDDLRSECDDHIKNLVKSTVRDVYLSPSLTSRSTKWKYIWRMRS